MTMWARMAMRLMGRGDEASCGEVARQLQGFLDGEIDRREARRIDKHLEACRRCGLEARTYREIKSAVARQGAPVDPDAVRRLRAFGESLSAEQPSTPPESDTHDASG